VKSAWGVEVFPAEGTSAENEMSIVQYAVLCGERVMLTGDAGRGTLAQAVEYAPSLGVTFPGVDKFQVPHHGSRRNVNSELLDALLGTKNTSGSSVGTFIAMISSAKADHDHPRRAVVRAMIHRGATVITTEGQSIRVQKNAPARPDYTVLAGVPYPDDQEAD
jgi:beta-lactamase superfamily II metal-dependent hydrolase